MALMTLNSVPPLSHLRHQKSTSTQSRSSFFEFGPVDSASAIMGFRDNRTRTTSQSTPMMPLSSTPPRQVDRSTPSDQSPQKRRPVNASSGGSTFDMMQTIRRAVKRKVSAPLLSRAFSEPTVEAPSTPIGAVFPRVSSNASFELQSYSEASSSHFSVDSSGSSSKTHSSIALSEARSDSGNRRVPDSNSSFEVKGYMRERRSMRLHPYSQNDVPYMQAYNQVLLDNDRYTHTLLRRLNSNGTPSFHNYGKKPPTDVLDLGCGQGTWVIEAATAWKAAGTKVTGLDIVDLTSDVWELERGLAENVTWLLANFTQYALPFADDTFDFVRMSNLTLCIPYNRWGFVLAEVQRVLRPGGRLELIDDDLFFPYPPSSSSQPSSFPAASATQSGTSSFSSSSINTPGLESVLGIVDPDILDSPSFYSQDESDEDLKFPAPPTGPLPHPSILEERRKDDNTRKSQELELVFEQMLRIKYGIHTRPSEFVERMLSHVFGQGQSKKTHSLHVALAQPDSAASDKASDGNTRKSLEKESGSSWIQWDKKDKREERGDRTSQDSLPPGAMSSQGTLNAKAAKLLGMLPDASAQDGTSRNATLNAKAAKLLGLGPEPAGQAPQIYQPPGLVVWPGTFIPLSPSELEIHTCKHLHMLLGCKVALHEFISDFTNDDGSMVVSYEELNESLWDYECSRRKRFNWPSSPDMWDVVERPLSSETPKTSHFRIVNSTVETPSTSGRPRSGSTSARSSVESTDVPSDQTFVRAVRVYEAFKVIDDEKH